MAKGIVKKTEKAARKQLRQEGAFKGLSRKERIALSKKTASEARNWVREKMAEGRKARAVKKSASDAKKRKAAMASGQKLAYDKGTPGAYEGKPAEQREKAPGGVPTKKMRPGDKVSKEKVKVGPGKGMYKIVGADGYVRYSMSKPAMYGAKVKAVKKAQEGSKVKSKSLGVLKSDTNKAGPKMEEGKEPYTKNGITYTWEFKILEEKYKKASKALFEFQKKASTRKGIMDPSYVSDEIARLKKKKEEARYLPKMKKD